MIQCLGIGLGGLTNSDPTGGDDDNYVPRGRVDGGEWGAKPLRFRTARTVRQVEQGREDGSLEYTESGSFSGNHLFRSPTILLCFWSFLGIAYVSSVLLQPAGIYDEGLIVTGAARILHGQVPYRDFYTGYPPGQFYTIAGAFKVFGTDLLAERVWGTLWRLAIIGFTVVLARAATPGQRPHLLPLICVGLYPVAIDGVEDALGPQCIHWFEIAVMMDAASNPLSRR